MANFISEWWREWFTVAPEVPVQRSVIIPDSVKAGGPEMEAAYMALLGQGVKAAPQGTGQFMECDLLHVQLTSALTNSKCGIDGCDALIHPLPDDPEILKAKVFQLATQNLQLGEQSKGFYQLNEEQIKLVRFWQANFNPDFTGALGIGDMVVLKVRELMEKVGEGVKR